MDENKSLVIQYNDEIKRELADPHVIKALLATTFKGLSEDSMKRAILEGMIRGYKFKDFMDKQVYVIPFKESYSLVTSIDRSRKLGAKGGVIGKSAPKYEYEDSGAIINCSVTVYTKDGHQDGYTATVYFKEYYKAGYSGKPSLWDTKPHTMIAKVAEMHALRMACPEVLGQEYIEEEFDNSVENRSINIQEMRADAPTMGSLDKSKQHNEKNSKANNEFEVAGNHADDSSGEETA